ncbi:hypothetical protein UR09_06565 [Candidatus Nitromaritima sp. SCGC AAA799-A02]|nr:hypothetical protein UR09_06565 [Candidatus Nitromaritima sp. SCGC AAA799-A02]
MPILWREEMCVGNKEIDDYHKYLVCLVNTVEAAVNCGLERGVLLSHANELLLYAKDHFAKEEALQVAFSYQHHLEHKKAHEDLIHRLVEIISNLENQKDGRVMKNTIDGLFNVLRDWLVNHILNEDMKMKEFLKSVE